ncbi:MAG: hypothetical protein WCK05_07295 [Planctomycetota bacterium]
MTNGFTRTGLGVLLMVSVFLPAGGAEPGAEPAAATAPDHILAQAIENPRAFGTLEDILSACERQASRFGRLAVIVDWAELADAGITRDAHVTVESKSATVRQYLDRALQAASPQPGRLGWYRVETTVFVTTQDYIARNMSRIATLAVASDGVAKIAGASPPAAPVQRRTSSGVSFDDAPLETVFDYVREISDVGLHVNWRALEVAGVTKTTPVSIQIKNLSGSRILDLTVDQLTTGDDKLRRVYWCIEDGIVLVTTGQALNDSPLTSKVFQIGSMLAEAPNFIGPRIDATKLTGQGQGGQGGGGGGSPFGAGDAKADTSGGDSASTPSREERRKQLQEQIVALIKGTTTADMWEPEGKGKITLLRDRAIVTQTKLGWLLMGKH